MSSNGNNFRSLPSGKGHELESTGVTHLGQAEVPYLVYDLALKDAMARTRELGIKVQGREYLYDPANPTNPATLDFKLWGVLPELFSAVKKYLPKRPGLFLYNAIGLALDVYHGPDIFFEWDGVYYMIDLSLRKKAFRHWIDSTVKLGGITEEGLDDLGRQIAEALKCKRGRRKRLLKRGYKI